jgi:hypothetical protein
MKKSASRPISAAAIFMPRKPGRSLSYDCRI